MTRLARSSSTLFGLALIAAACDRPLTPTGVLTDERGQSPTRHARQLLAEIGTVPGAPAPGRVISVVGHAEVDGLATRVEVLLHIPDGVDAAAAAGEAMEAAGALPIASSSGAEFVLTGLRWRQYFDGNPGNDFVLQSYNPADAPASGDFVDAFQMAQAPWGDVATATFAIRFAGLTRRCPSLMFLCPGGARLDGFKTLYPLEFEPLPHQPPRPRSPGKGQ